MGKNGDLCNFTHLSDFMLKYSLDCYFQNLISDRVRCFYRCDVISDDSIYWVAYTRVPFVIILTCFVTVPILLATLSEQCASTWRWLRSWALKLDSEDNSGCVDGDSIKQPSIRISHSLPDLTLDPSLSSESKCPTETKEGKKVNFIVYHRYSLIFWDIFLYST